MEWPIYSFSKMVERFISGGTPSTKNESYWNGSIPWITGADFFNGKVRIGRRYISEEAINNSATNVVPKGSILLVTRTGVGKIDIAAEDIAISQDITGIILKPGVDYEYVQYALQSKMEYLLLAQRGATIKGVTRKDVKGLALPLPGLSEQRRIVEILDQADALRKKRAEADAKAARILPALFYKMFGDPVTNPMGWPVKPLGDLGELDRGKSKHRPRNDPKLLGGPHPFIQTGDVANSNGYIRSYSSTYSDFGLAQSKKWPAGTLCITIAANIAASGILGFNACFPDSVVGFKSGEQTNVAYVRILLGFVKPILEKNAPQMAQKNINLKILRRLPVPVPDKILQDKFQYQHDIVLGLHQSQSSTRRDMDVLWGAIVHRAFTGDLTAKWREAHMTELLVEMEEQMKTLNGAVAR